MVDLMILVKDMGIIYVSDDDTIAKAEPTRVLPIGKVIESIAGKPEA